MGNIAFTQDSLQEEEAAVEAQLQDLLSTSETDGALKLTGLEILGFLACKIVLPIACSFVGRVLYDKYKSMCVASQAAEARETVEKAVTTKDTVDEQTVIEELTSELTKEGVPEEVARQAVTDTYRRMEQRYGPLG